MEIHTHSCCGISQSTDWQHWLGETDPELHSDLMLTLSKKRGCRTNSNKMKEIYVKLYDRGHGSSFEDFITRRFPWLIKSHEPARPKQATKPFKALKPVKKQPKLTTQQAEDLNKHKVFKDYRPNILSFPQKLIISGNPNNLQRRVQAFTRDKLAVDWIIIEDRAYIEYFKPQHAALVDRIPREKREIYQYRQKLEQNG